MRKKVDLSSLLEFWSSHLVSERIGSSTLVKTPEGVKIISKGSPDKIFSEETLVKMKKMKMQQELKEKF